ncbi:MAG: hypothetical protein ACLSWS_21490 [Faecalispora jeddahensis]
MPLQSLTGHPFLCPDMIGGGEYHNFYGQKVLDHELMVRWANCLSDASDEVFGCALAHSISPRLRKGQTGRGAAQPLYAVAPPSFGTMQKHRRTGFTPNGV